MRILGIDPGVAGAIACFESYAEPVLMWVADMPTLEDGPKGRRTINAQLLAHLIATSHAGQVFTETVGVRPGEGALGAFSFGRGVGVIHGICAAFDLVCGSITPQAWKKFHGLQKESKDASRSKAIALWPSMADKFARKMDTDRAEACLIGLAGLRMAK